METKDRTKTAQKIIKDKLSQYLSEKQLSMLDDLGIEILADYFSNAQLRDMAELEPAQVKGLVDRNQDNEVKRRLTFITEEEYESGKFMDWYKANCSDIEEVYDPQAEQVIALEVKHSELKNSPAVHWDGRFIVAIGDRLASTRTRLDGVVGYQSNVEVLNPDFVPAHNDFNEKREKLVAAHNAKIEKAHKAHHKKLQKAWADHQKKLEKYAKDMLKYEKKLESDSSINNIADKDKGVKVLSQPVMPEYIEPEYVGVEPFEEMERPDVEQFLPATDSRWADIETENIPEERVMSSISDSDIVKVKEAIDSSGYKKPVKKIKDGYQVDKFILRRVK